ncbi:MAG: alpha/beta hydrolase [Endomicrobium sp.]|jgi:acetyl esterase/lipase|nr:alpha/beta hydrolase [Endomicrobium sp.]
MKFVKRAFIIAFFLILSVTFLFVSPWPEIIFLKISYKRIRYALPEKYESYKEKVIFHKDIDYNSAYPSGFLDIIMPKEHTGKEKLIFWVHGGSFIGGDKKNVEHYMAMLAGKGFSVVSINYAVAPGRHYPVPVKQLEEAYFFIKENAGKYDLDMRQVYFGGDSSGAQIAAQFANIQTNAEYKDRINDSVKPVRFNDIPDKNSIKGTVLFCGVYDLEKLINPEKNTMSLPFKKIGRAYFDTSDEKNINLSLSGITGNVSENYPPSFITDGNTFTFENQAKALETALKGRNVYVKSVFYDKSEAVLKHEYQFNMNNPFSWKTFEETVNFLNADIQKHYQN